MKLINADNLKKMFIRGNVLPEDESLIYAVCETVFNSHFTHRFDIKEDLLQEGALGLIRLVDEGNYNADEGVFTFAYSRVRNSMTNFLYYENKIVNTEVDGDRNIKLGVSFDDFYALSEELIQDIQIYISGKIDELELSQELEYYVKAYFNDKLGVKYQKLGSVMFLQDFVDKYRFYVNTIEFEMFKKFMSSRVFENKPEEILDVLESEGEVSFYMRMFMDSLSPKQRSLLMYVYSGNRFEFPSKYKLLKTDNYLSIYRRVRHGNMSEEDAARIFNKPLPTIMSILERFDIIFS